MQFLFRATAALALAAAVAACDSPTGEKKTDRPDLEAGTTVQGQVTPGRTVEYDLVPPAADFRILLQARSGTAADTLVAELVDANGTLAAQVQSVGTDTALAAQASAWLRPPAGDGWRIRVRGRGADDGGAYALRLFAQNPAPETLPAAVTPGQVVQGESLDVGGDVDEFVIQGTAGQEWLVFAQSQRFLEVQLVENLTREVVSTTATHSRAATLEENSGGRVRLPRTGEYTLRVFAPLPHEGSNPYRLRVDVVNRAPEGGGAALALGAVAEETIGSVGDVDEFTFSAAAGQEINLLLQLRSGMAGRLTMELLHGTQRVARLEPEAPAASPDDFGTGRIALAGGVYTVRLYGPAAGTAEQATGSYRLELYPVDPRPEAGGRLVVNGESAADAVDRPGDVDDFTFSGTAGQMVVLHVSGPAPSRGRIRAELLGTEGEQLYTDAVLAGNGTVYALRKTLPATGTYRVRVAGQYTGSMATGPYTLGAYTVSAAPEHVPATLQVGQTLTGERIDRPGDLDVFTLQGEAGREVAVFLGAEAGRGAVFASLRPSSQAHTFIFLSSTWPSLDARSTGRIRLEAVPYTLVVDPNMYGPHVIGYSEGGSYALRIFPINRAPEGRSAAYALGDTVKGEPVYPAVDVDEYTFEVAAPTPVRIHWQTGDGMYASVFGALWDERTGANVWNNLVTHNGQLVRQMTLPAGRYRMRVASEGLGQPTQVSDPANTTLRYEFSFIP